ncbi:unnamed protein product, partial [Rangifer tarandus platyrhynchus]
GSEEQPCVQVDFNKHLPEPSAQHSRPADRLQSPSCLRHYCRWPGLTSKGQDIQASASSPRQLHSTSATTEPRKRSQLKDGKQEYGVLQLLPGFERRQAAPHPHLRLALGLAPLPQELENSEEAPSSGTKWSVSTAKLTSQGGLL